MKKLFALMLLIAGPANASPITLVCQGDLSLRGHQKSTIDGETAIIDIESGTFKPPMYTPYPLLRVEDAEISFGRESATLSVWGILDRISGSLTMNVMEPADRKRLKEGATVPFLAFMSAKCVPAKRMF